MLPGGTRIDVLEISGPNAWTRTPDGVREIHGALEGRFRVAYDVHLCGGDCYDPGPDEMLLSNEFVVTLD